MLARDAIDIMQNRMGGHLSRTLLRGELNIAQNEILCLRDIPLCKVPGNIYLATQAGVTTYASLPYRVVTRVYERMTQAANPNFAKRYPTSVVQGLDSAWEQDYTFDCTEATSPTGTCTVRFPVEMDPLDTTDTYLLEAYTWPAQLTSESVEMTLPDHWVTSLLYYAIKAKIEESAYGVDIYNDPKLTKLLSSLLTRQANAPKATQPRRQPRF